MALRGAEDAQVAALDSLRRGSGAGASSREGAELGQTSRRPGAVRSACRKEVTRFRKGSARGGVQVTGVDEVLRRRLQRG